MDSREKSGLMNSALNIVDETLFALRRMDIINADERDKVYKNLKEILDKKMPEV